MADVLLRKAPEPRDLIKRMREYHPPLGSRAGLRLDFNENTFECSPRVLETLGKIAASDLTKYPEREPVERKVAAFLGLEAGQVLLTNGVDEGIHVLCQTFLDRGDELLLPTPTYAMYEVYASATEGTIKIVGSKRRFSFSAGTPAGSDHAANQDHCDRQSQQSDRSDSQQRKQILRGSGERAACGGTGR